ncbi:putative membrane protein [Mycobacterium ulcerans str. Harvey]|uniref:Membrane protein n=1 Tax=Mycobacterium ulcerans str. Harvey TaxID=1299332 RepID=A0ABP3AK97_MYCUL|nr:putative membrane protein [Mycobacterium ulcerans str. Harvey]
MWNRIRERFGLVGLFAGSAILSIAAAVIAIAFQLAGSWPNLVAISLVIALASIANQSVFTAGQLRIAHNADPTLRISLIAFGRLVISAGLVGLSSLLGILAQFHDVVWPVMIVLLLNVAAAYSAKRLAPAD